MDFFGAQERARRLSGWLVALFVLAVGLVILTVYLVLAAILLADEATLWDASLLLTTAGVLGAVIGGASLIRTVGLRSGGGAAVAEMLAGRLVHPGTRNPDERRFLNVVEEMALAAGTPVPPVYVLDRESSINAFAAGYSPEDAVIGITRGALEAFSRDEMQAVAAHEFSHIVYRDIRLNIRLTGLLFGLLALGLAGRMLLRIAFFSGGGRRDGRAVAALMALGLALFLTGYLGVLFGRIIRAAVSRQREFLADAAAVQWTRNPDAMAAALKKIGAVGSRLDAPAAEEVSHFFFAQGLKTGLFASIFATHPPLVERIRRIDPSFDGDYSQVRREAGSTAEERPAVPQRGPAFAALAGDAPAAAVPPLWAAERVPPVHPGDIPAELYAAAHEPFRAGALIYALILDRDRRAREAQVRVLEALGDPQLLADVGRLLTAVEPLPPNVRMALVDLAAPALRLLSDTQTQEMLALLARLAAADRRLSVFEFALKTTVQHRLRATHGAAASPSRFSAARAKAHARPLLAALALVGHARPETSRAAFRAGLRELGVPDDDALPPATADDVREALDALADAPRTQRARVLAACAATVHHDGEAGEDEVLLLRAIAAALDTPVTPPDATAARGTRARHAAALR